MAQDTLLEEYAIVCPVESDTSKAAVPPCKMKDSVRFLSLEKQREESWVEHSLIKLVQETISSNDAVTWTAYHASTQIEEDQPALTALLPLFYEKAATPAMVKHGMDVLKQAITFLNPDQIPIIAVDQPLFALARMVQWKWPSSHGEQAYVVMLGGLHVEMALWNVLDDLLDGSGWTTALSEAEVGSSGGADSFLKAAHLTRTRYGVQSLKDTS